MKSYKTSSLADQVFERLETDIIRGVYARGEILTELKLVEQLGVSRTPIREALRRLEQERLIEETGKGSRVLGITADDLLDIMNIRLNVEGLATYYATVNMTEEGLRQLEHVVDLQEFYYSKKDAEHIRVMDDQFHELICRLSKRTVIADTLMPLHRKTQRYRKASIENKNRTEAVLREHRAIFEAIKAGDAELAQRLTVEHIQNAKQSVMERVNNLG
ncbi:MAG: GntR family transcriptional regulator [Oscillospiraceae bacterium]|nr:GntR family transcriptional regulator [Oscillospiraceae bacterium]